MTGCSRSATFGFMAGKTTKLSLRLVFVAITGLIKKQVFEAGNQIVLGGDSRWQCGPQIATKIL